MESANANNNFYNLHGCLLHFTIIVSIIPKSYYNVLVGMIMRQLKMTSTAPPLPCHFFCDFSYFSRTISF